MENKNNNSLQQALTDNVQQLADMSLSFAKPVIENLLGNFTTLSQSLFTGDGSLKIPEIKLQSDSCTPKSTCPPHCIASIERTAMPMERIVVPFTVKNTCNTAKAYQVGIRPLTDQDGQAAPVQPQLNKDAVTLAAGASERVLMVLDLANFQSGKTYSAEIVLREKAYNQNICFTLHVSEDSGPLVTPYEEKKYQLKWHGWQSHYYCESPKSREDQQG